MNNTIEELRRTNGQAEEKSLNKKLVKLQSIIEDFDNKFLDLGYFEFKKAIQIGKILIERNVKLVEFESQNTIIINIVDSEYIK